MALAPGALAPQAPLVPQRAAALRPARTTLGTGRGTGEQLPEARAGDPVGAHEAAEREEAEPGAAARVVLPPGHRDRARRAGFFVAELGAAVALPVELRVPVELGFAGAQQRQVDACPPAGGPAAAGTAAREAARTAALVTRGTGYRSGGSD